VISLGGDWFLLVALFGLVYDFTGSAIAVALLLGVQDLTYVVMSPFAGVLADRIDRKTLMVASDLARALVCVGFFFVRSSETVWLVYVLLGAMAIFSAVFEPSSAAAMPNLVEREDLATANALSGSLWGTMLAVGAALRLDRLSLDPRDVIEQPHPEYGKRLVVKITDAMMRGESANSFAHMLERLSWRPALQVTECHRNVRGMSEFRCRNSHRLKCIDQSCDLCVGRKLFCLQDANCRGSGSLPMGRQRRPLQFWQRRVRLAGIQFSPDKEQDKRANNRHDEPRRMKR